MSALTRLTRLFRRSPARRPALARPPRRARLDLEQLEGRDAPVALSFTPSAAVYGAAALDGGRSSGVRYLRNFNTGDIARKTSSFGFPSSHSYASLSNYSGASSYKSIDATTHAYTTNFNSSTEAVVRTTTNGSSYQYVTVQIVASSWGEQNGQRVQVTLTPRFVSTIGQFNRGYASNGMSFYVNGRSYINQTDTTRGRDPEVFSRTITLTGTIGSTFQIAFQVSSYAQATVGGGVQNNYNVATNNFSLGMEVRRI
jgi:hypothetical protein